MLFTILQILKKIQRKRDPRLGRLGLPLPRDLAPTSRPGPHLIDPLYRVCVVCGCTEHFIENTRCGCAA